MLPTPHRLRRRRDFGVVSRRGRRAASGTLVLHLARSAEPPGGPARQPVRVGFVVGRSCGPAVARNRLRRRLRHLVSDRLPDLPAGAMVVVRALPAAGGADHTALAADLTGCLDRLLGSGGARG
ncbi:MAG: ribonuclease P protein component [Actinomycetota bacterium]|nr:ribonuclease P protein component [Actinomycetota bacterium]